MAVEDDDVSPMADEEVRTNHESFYTIGNVCNNTESIPQHTTSPSYSIDSFIEKPESVMGYFR